MEKEIKKLKRCETCGKFSPADHPCEVCNGITHQGRKFRMSFLLNDSNNLHSYYLRAKNETEALKKMIPRLDAERVLNIKCIKIDSVV